ncbi:hypothetical protein ACTFIR_008825 [Dictyostelium discoideum]
MKEYKKIILYSFLVFLILCFAKPSLSDDPLTTTTTTATALPTTSAASTAKATTATTTTGAPASTTTTGVPASTTGASTTTTGAPSSSSSSNETTPTVTPTKKPVTPTPSSSTSSSSEVTSSSSESSAGEHPCATDVFDSMSNSGNFQESVSSSTNDPYDCYLQSSNVKFTKSGTTNVARLILDSAGCPTSCLTHSYSCAEIQSQSSLNYGTYTFIAKVSPIKNVITKLYASTGGNSQYSDIYFQIFGNTTRVNYGYTYFGQKVNYYKDLTGVVISSTNTYSFDFSKTQLSFFFNGILLGKFDSSAYNGVVFPVPPLTYYTSITSNPQTKIAPSSLPTYSDIVSFNYTAGVCTDSSDGGNNWHDENSLLYFFTSNCTNYRPIPIFNDSFNDGWNAGGNTLIKFINSSSTQSQYARIGTAFSFSLNSGAEYLLIQYNQTAIPIKQNKYIMFWINGGQLGNQNLVVYLTLAGKKIGSVNIGEYIHGSLLPQTWYKVIIPFSKITITPSTTKTFNGILITGASNEFYDLIYMDDLYFSNGTVCMEESSKYPYYQLGQLLNGASDQYNTGNVNFKSVSKLFRGFPTIEYQLYNNYKAIVSMMNGTIDTSQYDLLRLNFFFLHDQSYNNPNPGVDSSEVANSFFLDLQICITVQVVGNLPCVGLSPYLGGQVPNAVWVELLIPFSDLQVYPNALISSITFQTQVQDHQGVFFIGDISAGNFVPPYKVIEDGSNAFKLFSNIYLLLLIFIISLLFI